MNNNHRSPQQLRHVRLSFLHLCCCSWCIHFHFYASFTWRYINGCNQAYFSIPTHFWSWKKSNGFFWNLKLVARKQNSLNFTTRLQFLCLIEDDDDVTQSLMLVRSSPARRWSIVCQPAIIVITRSATFIIIVDSTFCSSSLSQSLKCFRYDDRRWSLRPWN